MVTRIGLAARRSGLSIAAFQAHWHDRHGPLVAKFRNVRRVWQHHALLCAGSPLLPWPGFDACSEMEFDDLAAVRQALSEEHYPRELREDSGHLIDASKSATMLVQRVCVAGSVDLRHIRLLTFLRRAHGRTQAELNAALRRLPLASGAHARELYLPLDEPEQMPNGFDAVEAQWFGASDDAESYVVSPEAGEHRFATAHLARGVERVIARVRVIL
jgi:uncharacterized protein (TIGR02118 family)